MIIFGTLFKSEMGGIKDLLVLLGKRKEVEKIDKEYQIRKFFGPWGLSELAKLYQGFSEDKLRKISSDYAKKNLLAGLKEAVIIMKNKPSIVGAISSNPQFLLDASKEIVPFDFAAGTELEFKKGVATGKIKKEVNRYVKAEILKEKQKEYQVSKENTIIIGRLFPAHLPMADYTGAYIGFDPTKETIKKVTKMIRTNNKELKELLF